MRIGELSRRTAISVRMLRYYEQRGLLTPTRGRNGYREYGEEDVERATLVSSMIRSGLPTKLIVPILRGEGDAELRDRLIAERDRLDSRIACMSVSRAAIEAHLARLSPSTSDSAPPAHRRSRRTQSRRLRA
jgi:DNA-binding transcriptional MerR regulator